VLSGVEVQMSAVKSADLCGAGGIESVRGELPAD